MLATVNNMLRVQDTGAFMYSFNTGEEASADPSDYFWMNDGDYVFNDEFDEPMVLMRKVTLLEEIED